jgi:hypothetical protein
VAEKKFEVLPEDRLALMLADAAANSHRESEGDEPCTHSRSFRDYRDQDVESWRAVSRKVLSLLGHPVKFVSEPCHIREAVWEDIRTYAGQRRRGKSRPIALAEERLNFDLDFYRERIIDRTVYRVVRALLSATHFKH